jgi:hypothetical protein
LRQPDESTADLIPMLPGLAFDEYLPYLRATPDPLTGALVYGKHAQEWQLAEFSAWVISADAGRTIHGVVSTFDSVWPLATPPPGAVPADRVVYTVRANQRTKRLWSETSYTSEVARTALFDLLYQLVWNWVATGAGGPGAAPAVLALVSPPGTGAQTLEKRR